MAHERAKTSLLYSLLSLIFMSPSSRVHDESLDNFLVKMGLMANFNRDTAPSHQNEIQAKLMKMFGVTDIKAFIKEEYCKKQHYIQIIEVSCIFFRMRLQSPCVSLKSIFDKQLSRSWQEICLVMKEDILSKCSLSWKWW